MLVLSRRPEEAIVFPKLGITVRILRLSRQVARVGIEAPPEIRVLRKELGDGTAEETFDVDSFGASLGASSEELHELRNQLNVLNLGLQFYRQQMDAGLTEEANKTFLLVLDQLDQIERRVGEQAEAAEKMESLRSSVHPLRLLLVEDDDDQRELLAGVLSMRGCEVATAADGEAALEYLESNEAPDFVLMDMRMPGRDGPSTVRKIRQSTSAANVRVLAISGTSPAEFGIQQGPEGVDCWFPKPLNTEGLLQYLTEPNASKIASPV